MIKKIKNFSYVSDRILFLTLLWIMIYLNITSYSVNKILIVISLILLNITLVYWFQKSYLLLTILPVVTNECRQTWYYSSNKLYMNYQVVNRIKNSSSCTSTCGLYVIEIHKKRCLLRSYSKKKYFIEYGSLLYQPNKKYDFFIEKQVIEEKPLRSLRSWLYSRIKHFNLPYLLPILLGIKEGDFSLFKKTGTWHLLCVGGLHMHFLRSLILFIGRCFLGKNPSKIYPIFYFIELIFLWLFAYMSGSQVPALRSVMMLSLDTISRLLRFNIPVEIRYCLAFLFLLSYNIDYIFDLGFQMSFLAVYMIISFANYFSFIYRYYYKIHYCIYYLFKSLYINILIGIGTILHGFLLHGNTNLLGPLLNCLSIPIFMIGLAIMPFLGLCNFAEVIARYIFVFLETILFYGDKYGLFLCLKIKKRLFISYYLIPYIIFIVAIKYILLYKIYKANLSPVPRIELQIK